MTPATAASAPAPVVEPEGLCGVNICARRAEMGGFCTDHREEQNQSHRDWREEHVRSQRRFWLEGIGLPKMYWGATFADARPTASIKALLAYRDAKGGPRGRAVILASQTGTGKTYAAACLVNDVLPFLASRQRFILGAELVRDLLNFKTVERTMEDAAGVPLLVIDDLQEPPRAEGLALLEELLIRRHADGRPLVVTTNLRRQPFEAAFGDRISDRLKDWGTYHELPGKSLRGGA